MNRAIHLTPSPVAGLVPSSAEVQFHEPHGQTTDQSPGVFQLLVVSEGRVPALSHDGARHATNHERHGLRHRGARCFFFRPLNWFNQTSHKVGTENDFQTRNGQAKQASNHKGSPQRPILTGIPMLTAGLGSSALVGGFGILEPRLSVSRVQQIFAHANGSLPGFCFRDVLQLLSSTPAADVLELWQLELCGKYFKYVQAR